MNQKHRHIYWFSDKAREKSIRFQIFPFPLVRKSFENELTTGFIRKRLLFFILLCVFSTTLMGQARVTSALDSTAILIGDHLKLHLRILKADNVANPISNLKVLEEAEGIEIIHTGKWDTINIGKGRALQQDITITSFDSGYYFIPKIPVNFKQNGKNITQSSSQLAFAVNTVLTNAQEIAPIKEIIKEPLRFEDFLPYLLLMLCLAALMGIGIFLYRTMRQKNVKPPPPPVILPPHEIAINKLKELKSKDLWRTGEVKAYQSELTYIVREYLENRYEIQALESTSDEIMRDLKRDTDITEPQRMDLREMFTMADLVKFAKAKPPEDANEKLMASAESFVEKTKKIIIKEATASSE